MIIDAHVHLWGDATATDVQAFRELSGVDRFVLFSRNPYDPGVDQKMLVENLARLAATDDSIIPFAWLDPRVDGAPDLVGQAVREWNIRGVKLIPNGWYPEDQRARAVYAAAAECGVPILFHSGILWLECDCSRYCRPAGYECMWDTPTVKFALAHIGWPWTDECTAVVQKFSRLRPERDQAFIDLTPGTPPIYRRPALERCLALVGAGRLMYGSDSVIPFDTPPRRHWETDRELLIDLGASEADLDSVFSGNVLRFLATDPQPD